MIRRFLTSFNTSHVVVYLGFLYSKRQIVPCFNTSHVVVYLFRKLSVLFSDMFQYISCCSLSIRQLSSFFFYFCFNTSHVVVYRKLYTIINRYASFQYISCCSLSQLLPAALGLLFVSIHLML